QDVARGLDLINTVIDAGSDPRQLARQLVDYLRGLLLIRLGSPALVEAYAGVETRKVMQQQAAKFEPGKLLQALKAFNTASEQRTGWISQLPLELALVECIRSAVPIEAPAPTPGRGEVLPAAPPPAAKAQPSPPASAAAPVSAPVMQLGEVLAK